jgi:flagellar basal-body rod protein FlgB
LSGDVSRRRKNGAVSVDGGERSMYARNRTGEAGEMRNNMTADVLEKTLHGLSRRLETVSRNIANMNTPDYDRHEISFEDQLRDVIEGPSKLPLRTTDPAHISNVTRNVPEVAPVQRAVSYEQFRLDGNNVDPETEMSRLTQTRLMYDIIANRMGGKFRGMRRVISGGG